VWNVLTLWVLHIPVSHRLADRHVCELRFSARRSGKQVALPVMYAQQDDTLVVLVGWPDRKRWWRNFFRSYQVQVWLHGKTRPGSGHVVDAASPHRAEMAKTYNARFPGVAIEDDPMVVIDLDASP
jgi:hypothetical protein